MNMNSGEDDNLSFENEERDDEFQEKLDFEENETISDENANESNQKNLSMISLSSENGASLSDEGAVDDKSNEIASKNTIIKLTNVIRNGEDGELHDDTDEDLEEGELKDDDEDNNPLNQSLDAIINNSEQKKVPCKFYSNGFCTWGDQCRFSHTDAPSTSNNYKPKPVNQQPTFQRTNSSSRNYQKPLYTRQYSNEYENQIYDSELRYESYDATRYDARTNYKDYERKRRLALESAPSWNDEYFEQRNSRTDSYRTDSYRNRYSDKGELNARNIQPSTNHSNSSTFSDFSESEKSFKQREPSPPQRKRKYSGHASSPNHPHYSSSKRVREDDSSPNSSLFSDSGDEFENKASNRVKSLSPRQRRSRSREPQSREKSRIDRAGEHSGRVKHRDRRSIEKEEKKPIKMTFMRKQANLIGGKGEFESEEEDFDEDFDAYGVKNNAPCAKVTKAPEKSTSCKSSGSSRDELLKRLKEIDEAIAKKRSRT